VRRVRRVGRVRKNSDNGVRKSGEWRRRYEIRRSEEV